MDIEEILAEEVKLKDSSKMFYQEMKQNVKLEAACILACEAGEWGTEILGYTAGVPFFNEVGILGGIAAGGSYALYHVYKHAKHHPEYKASIADASIYAGTTESGCIIGATLAEYFAGKIAANNNPLSAQNAMIRAVAIVPAFMIGLGLMSAFTYSKKKEVARFITDKDALPNIESGLKQEMSKNKLTIQGKSPIIIKEKKIPKTYQEKYNKDTESLYLVQSKLARANPEVSCHIKDYTDELFTQVGYNLNYVENIYSCSGGHHDHDHDDGCCDHDH